MKLTTAQQNMINRAKAGDGTDQHYHADRVYRSVSEHYKRPYVGCTRLRGSGDHRVARKLEEIGAGKLASLAGTEGYYFILRDAGAHRLAA